MSKTNASHVVTLAALGAGVGLFSTAAMAVAVPAPTISVPSSCGSGVGSSLSGADFATFQTALKNAVQAAGNGGLGFNMWATIVANDGTVCAVAFSGGVYTDQWLASRVISAQKAATANSLSLGATANSRAGGLLPTGKLALSTGNLYSADRDGGSLFGLQFSNPVDSADAYHVSGAPGSVPLPTTFGTATDPMVGYPIGGINVFGGGLALYNNTGKVGGVGVSGDTSCTDHMVAWHLRHNLNLDLLKTDGIGGVAALKAGDTGHPDNIIFDLFPNTTPRVGNNGLSSSGFGHPTCVNNPAFDPKTKTPLSLPPVQ